MNRYTAYEEREQVTIQPTRANYDRVRRAAGIPAVGRIARPDGQREETWILAKPGRLDAAIKFARNAPMLPAGADGWAAPGAQLEFAITQEAILRYLRGLNDPFEEQ